MRMVMRCDCGFRVAGDAEEELVEAARSHSREAHATEITAETVLRLLHAGRRRMPDPSTGDNS